VADEADGFCGYYTIHAVKDGQIYGMLSVDGYSGQVWYHNWHGQFVDMLELDEGQVICSKEVRRVAKDPVCGMTVDEEKATAKSEYMGKTCYFCSQGCKVAFEKDPEKYLRGEGKHH
jgi:YHS domain-containing protein